VGVPYVRIDGSQLPDWVPSEMFDSLNECAAFVNWRRIEVGEPAFLALSFSRTEPSTPSSST